MTPARALVAEEVLKLRAVRTPWLLLAGAQVLVLAGVAGALSQSEVADRAATTGALAHAGLASLFPLVLGITAVAGEYRHRTVTDSYLSTPRRGRVVLAKLGVHTAAGLGFGVVSSAVALAATGVWLKVDGGSLDLSDTGLWRTVIGCVGWNTAFGAIGVGVGAVVRNLPGAVAAALAWLALVEGVVGQLLGADLARWLPFAAGASLGRITDTASATLSQSGAGLVLAGYATAFTAAALAVTVRRDVT